MAGPGPSGGAIVPTTADPSGRGIQVARSPRVDAAAREIASDDAGVGPGIATRIESGGRTAT